MFKSEHISVLVALQERRGELVSEKTSCSWGWNRPSLGPGIDVILEFSKQSLPGALCRAFEGKHALKTPKEAVTIAPRPDEMVRFEVDVSKKHNKDKILAFNRPEHCFLTVKVQDGGSNREANHGKARKK